jgi:hypothetical protein
MMRLGRRATLLVALFLLASIATAYADRAWLLWSWSKWDEKHGKSWDMEGVWTDREGCLRQLGVHKQAAEMAGDMFIEHPSMLTVVSGVPKGEKPGRIWGNKFEFRCLPDTVDPRGPKGK